MGVIRRQSLKHVTVNLVGLVVGAASTFLVYPHVLEGYGLVQILLQVGLLGLPLMSLGANTIAIRFFPKFQDKSNGHNGFLPLLMLLCAAGFSLALALAALFWEPYMQRVQQHSPLIRQYLWMAFPMALCFVVSSVLAAYSANFKRIVVPSVLLDFSQKLILPFLMILVWTEWITLKTALWLMMSHSALVCLGMMAYLRWLGEWYWKPNWSHLNPELRKELTGFISFWSVGGFALLLAAKMDLFMVGSISAVVAAGSYSIALALAAIIELPIKSLYSASASFVAKHLADNNMEAMDQLYKSVSINLLVAGLLLFGGLWISIDSIFQFFPKSQLGAISGGIQAFFFIGMARIVEMSTGLNNNMLYYSPHYRYSLFSLTISAAMTLYLNFLLIPRFGMAGAGMATLCSVSFYNAFSVWLIWKKFGLFPFSFATVKALALAISAFLIARLIPHTDIGLLDIVIRSGFFALLFAFAVFRMNVSTELNDLWQVALKRLKASV